MPIANAKTLPNTCIAALVHSFHCLNPDNPKSLFVGWEGGVLRTPVRLPVCQPVVDWKLTSMTDKQNGGGRQLERVRANHRFSLR